MEVFLKRKDGTKAIGKYNSNTNSLVVLEGSFVSPTVSHSEKFRGADTVEKLREKYVKNGMVIKNLEFKSPSTAANFVTGVSSNGFVVWKDKAGRKLKEISEK